MASARVATDPTVKVGGGDGEGAPAAAARRRRDAGHHAGRVTAQAVDGVVAGAVAAEVFEAAEALLDVAVELGLDLLLGVVAGDAGDAQAGHDRDRHRRRRR